MPPEIKEEGMPLEVETPPVAPEEDEVKLTEDEKDFRDFVGVDHKEKADPAWDNKRFRAIYRKQKDSERSLKERENDFKVLAEHNRKLAESVSRLTESTDVLVQAETGRKEATIESEIATLETNVNELKTARSQARKEQDWETADRCDDEIERVKNRIADKKARAAEKVQAPIQPARPSVMPEMEAVEKWVQETDWFNPTSDNFNPAMTAAAKELDTAYMSRTEWKGKPVGDRLAKVKEKIETSFNYKKEPSRENGAGLVEGVGKETPPTTSVRVDLSEQERHIARRLFPDMKPADAEKTMLQQKQLLARRA